jgi:NADPH:quinone reductase-like Zn-dependent oxidoreductase
MRAVVMERYGGRDVLQVRDVLKPQPQADQILVRVRAAGINPVDWKIRSGQLRPLLPFSFPHVLGGEVAGEVAALGSDVSQFQPGDEVYSMTPIGRNGGYAEYVAIPGSIAARKPVALSSEEAAAIPLAGLTALQALRDCGKIAAGQAVLVNGAAGGVGTFAIQIAKAFGATVTGVCSAGSAGLVRELGADAVIDYGQDDFTRRSELYDIIFDAAAKRSFARCARVLRPRGCYITTLPGRGIFFWSAALPLAGVLGYGKRAKLILVRPNGDDLAFLSQLVEKGQLKPVIDRLYSLDQVQEGHARSESGHAHGKIVLRIV